MTHLKLMMQMTRSRNKVKQNLNGKFILNVYDNENKFSFKSLNLN